MAHVQQALGGIGHVVMAVAIIVVVALGAWRTMIRIVRLRMMRAM